MLTVTILGLVFIGCVIGFAVSIYKSGKGDMYDDE